MIGLGAIKEKLAKEYNAITLRAAADGTEPPPMGASESEMRLTQDMETWIKMYEAVFVVLCCVILVKICRAFVYYLLG